MHPDEVKSQEDFAAFLYALAREQWKGVPDESPLNRYLHSLARYVDGLDLDAFSRQRGRTPPEGPDWLLFADLHYGAKLHFEL
jgi:hypothetical protein